MLGIVGCVFPAAPVIARVASPATVDLAAHPPPRRPRDRFYATGHHAGPNDEEIRQVNLRRHRRAGPATRTPGNAWSCPAGIMNPSSGQQVPAALADGGQDAVQAEVPGLLHVTAKPECSG
jgi:hypothetical protein